MKTKTKATKLRIGGHQADSQGRYTYAVISQEDYARLSEFRWSIHSGGYAYSFVRHDGETRISYLHREVMQLQPGQGVVDHLSGDPLDCRRENLRVLESNALNLQNRRRGSGASSYRGAYRNKKKGKWIAQIRQDGLTLYGGSFAKEQEAAVAAEFFPAKQYLLRPLGANLPAVRPLGARAVLNR